MEALYTGTPHAGKMIWKNALDIEKYFLENNDVELIVEFKQAARVGPKMKLYAYYHGPLLDCALIGYIAMGWEGLDKVKVDYLLRAEFAKDFIKRPDGTYEPIMIDKHTMSPQRLLKFVQDCLLYIEQELQQTVPDSEEYKLSKITGRKFTRIEKE